MTADQKIVAIGSGSGIISMILLVAVIYYLWPVSPELTDIAARMGYTARALIFAALPLLIGIVTIANARFSSDAIARHAISKAGQWRSTGGLSTTLYSSFCCSQSPRCHCALC
jgi:hypothetical protein